MPQHRFMVTFCNCWPHSGVVHSLIIKKKKNNSRATTKRTEDTIETSSGPFLYPVLKILNKSANISDQEEEYPCTSIL